MPMITQFDRQEPFITPWWMVWGYISASGIGDPVKNKNYEHRKEMWKFHQFFQVINTIIPTIIFKLILVLKGRKIVKFLKVEKTPLTKIPTVKAAVISEFSFGTNLIHCSLVLWDTASFLLAIW